ncbi:MAG: MlaE family lipid ABC transporter permease subunit [Gammaproteobacteria bacterium]|nr:MlaE family lipid ABC transporter permease subunit [Gammaproteobacteria bacterium]
MFIQSHSKEKFTCQGEWILKNIPDIKADLKKNPFPAKGEIKIDGRAVTLMDSAGSWLLINTLKHAEKSGAKAQIEHFSEQHTKLLSIVKKEIVPEKKIPTSETSFSLADVGKATLEQLSELLAFLAFSGLLACEFVRVFFTPKHWRWGEIAGVIYKTGYQALPIIALLSFMIGVVISYQMGNQLRAYGANIFIVDLLGLSVLREFGPLITAIMVAGRTGSAFTAQLGIMKVNQEIDALNTMGITPAELLILPRLIGLFIALPLLTIWADIFGIMGGMMMAKSMLGVGWYDFLLRFQHEIPLRALIIGLGKAPVFALLIASISCFQGMRVRSSADSVGTQTTRSVVLAIFFIIVADAIFSVIFSKLNL